MKKLLKRLLVLLFIFVAAVAAVLFFTRNQEQETVYAVMSEATLPVVTMEFEGSAVNTLHGYTQSMDIPYMRDTQRSTVCAIPSRRFPRTGGFLSGSVPMETSSGPSSLK